MLLFIIVLYIFMRKVIISEQQEKELIKKLNEEIYQMPVDKKMNKPYTINPDKVLVVKKFLDGNFQKGNAEFIGNNGRLAKVRIISIPDSNGESLRDLTPDNLVDLLIDRFKNMFLDQKERELFMKQVVNDWINDKITVNGILTVNRLK